MNAPYEFWLHAHNEYLQWAIEAGVAGVIVLFLTQRAMRRSVTFADDLREPAIGALAAVAVQACFDFPIRIPANAAVIVCMLSLALAPRSDR
jgi:hypothetical protein